MNDKLVSIIIPCYNVEKYIERCLESVTNQSYKNLEIILVDDGSKDATPSLCDKWKQADNRIKVIHKENDGLANARNSGIEICSGDYVLFVDSDDFIDNDMVEYLLELSLKYHVDISRCSYYTFDNGTDNAPHSDNTVNVIDIKDDIYIDLIDGGHLSGVVWNKLYKAELVKSQSYAKEDGCSEDILYNFRVMKDVDKIVCSDLPKYHYCVNGESITNSEFGYGAFAIVRARRIMMDEFKNNKAVYPYTVKWFVRSSFIVLSGCIKSGKCLDRYDGLRNDILAFKKVIFLSRKYTFNHKLRTVILDISPRLYNYLVKKKG